MSTLFIWNGFMWSLSWISYSLEWNVGNGLKIRLGIDPITGLNAPYILPADLIDYLSDFGMTHLAQIQNLDHGSHSGNYWY